MRAHVRRMPRSVSTIRTVKARHLTALELEVVLQIVFATEDALAVGTGETSGLEILRLSLHPAHSSIRVKFSI